MTKLSLTEADAIANGVLEAATGRGLKPIAVAVLDDASAAVVVKRQDQATSLRVDLATAKANTSIKLQGPSRNFATMAEERPQFVTSVVTISQGSMVPAAGGVPIVRDGVIIGAVGVSGDTSDNDEAVALAGIQAAGLTPGG